MLALWLLPAAVFALAYVSPVEYVESDPAIALLAAQSLLDHRTLRLDAYRDDPACVYDLDRDYRVRRSGGAYAYYSYGVPLLSVPAVWLANQAGEHMLDRGDEHALQNLLSALCCALLGVVLYRLCRVFLPPPASLAISVVTLLGSSLVSTLATGLWNAGYAILLLALGVLHLARREADAVQPSLAYLALLAALAFLCRPTAAFAVAAAVALTPAAALRKRATWLLLGSGLLLLAVLAGLGAGEWLPRYYSWRKLLPSTPLPIGLDGVLLSPSRGLLVFSPFLVPVATAAVGLSGALWARPLFRMSAVWIALQVLAVATKVTWWGGHSYGPRLLVEVMLPAAVITCLAWRELSGRRVQIAAAAAYLGLGLAAIFIHSYQGLFNHHTKLWNTTPNVDLDPRLVFDWRHPQWLATEASLEERLVELQRQAFSTYSLGETIAHDGSGALFLGWYPPEAGWRWSRGTSSEIVLRLGDLPEAELYLLKLRAGALGSQEVSLEVNGAEAGRLELAVHAGRERAFAFAWDLLEPRSENRFRFRVPHAASTAEDPRRMGLALYALALEPLPVDFAAVEFADESFFSRGFSGAESGWRWTDGLTAAIDYPLGNAAGIDTLELLAGALGDQTVAVRLNGVELGELAYSGFAAQTRCLVFDPALLAPRRMNRIELTIEGARSTDDDDRLLGLAFVRLALRPSGIGVPLEATIERTREVQQ